MKRNFFIVFLLSPIFFFCQYSSAENVLHCFSSPSLTSNGTNVRQIDLRLKYSDNVVSEMFDVMALNSKLPTLSNSQLTELGYEFRRNDPRFDFVFNLPRSQKSEQGDSPYVALVFGVKKAIKDGDFFKKGQMVGIVDIVLKAEAFKDAKPIFGINNQPIGYFDMGDGTFYQESLIICEKE